MQNEGLDKVFSDKGKQITLGHTQPFSGHVKGDNVKKKNSMYWLFSMC